MTDGHDYDDLCPTYWGSHGCDKPPGHDGDHQCGSDEDPCSQHTGTECRYFLSDGTWGKWYPSTTFTLGGL